MQVLRWGTRPPNWEGRGKGWGWGVKNGSIRMCDISFLFAPRSDQSAISNRFRRTHRRYRRTDRQTDGQNWYSNSRPDAARYALASVTIMSVRPSVCLSVTLLDSAKTVRDSALVLWGANRKPISYFRMAPFLTT